MSSQCLNDNSFGPAVRVCRSDFDFTLLFEQIILTIVPSSIFILLGIARVTTLAHQNEVTSGWILKIGKQVSLLRGCSLLNLGWPKRFLLLYMHSSISLSWLSFAKLQVFRKPQSLLVLSHWWHLLSLRFYPGWSMGDHYGHLSWSMATFSSPFSSTSHSVAPSFWVAIVLQ